MSYEEKSTWVYAGIALVLPIIYFGLILSQAASMPVEDIAYQAPLIGAIVAAIVLAIVAAIVLAIAAPSEAGVADQRDKDVGRFGEYVGGTVLAILAVVPFLLAIAEVDHFWIANTLYLAFTISAFSGAVAKIVAYRRGL